MVVRHVRMVKLLCENSAPRLLIKAGDWRSLLRFGASVPSGLIIEPSFFGWTINKVCDRHMKITWSIPVWGETLASTRGDIVRARQLIAALGEAGHDVQVVERGTSSGTGAMVAGYRGVLKRILPRRMALILRDLSRLANSISFGRRVAKAAREGNADVIVETQMNSAASGAVAARLANLPLILDDCSPVSEEEEIGVGVPSLVRGILRFQANTATTVIATSRSVRDRLVGEGVDAAKVHIVRNGVNLDQFDQANASALRAELGLRERCVIGFVGSFLDWHRVDLLVDALCLMPNHAKPHLLLVGTGPNLAPVLEQCTRMGLGDHVTSVGSVAPSAIPGYLASFDIGVLPDTLDYGNPMKLTEYAAAAIPAVAPDRPSVREVVEDGQTGLLFEPQNANALAQVLTQLANDPKLRFEMGHKARNHVAVKSSWTVLARALIATLDRKTPPTAVKSVKARLRSVD